MEDVTPKKSAVMVDDWKAPIFKQYIDEAGLKYDETKSGEYITLMVFTYSLEEFTSLTQACMKATADAKRKSLH